MLATKTQTWLPPDMNHFKNLQNYKFRILLKNFKLLKQIL